LSSDLRSGHDGQRMSKNEEDKEEEDESKVKEENEQDDGV
jgi:hypothetical protein